MELKQPRRELVSIQQATQIVGVTRRTIYNWLATGKIEYVRTAGGPVRIFADTLYRSEKPPLRVNGFSRAE